MSQLRALDLFAGAGGATRGLQQAGFHVTGIDIKPQKNYCGDEFIQGDALTFLCSFVGGSRDGYPEICDRCGRHWDYAGHREFDFIWASPPCQAHTTLKKMWNAKSHVDLIPHTRALLAVSGVPYVIENVPGAPLVKTIELCGSMFGLCAEGAQLRRHRLFECSWNMTAPKCSHAKGRVIGVYGGHGRDRRRTVNTQDFSMDARRAAMGIDWMTGTELSQAIPPAYSKFIALAFLNSLKQVAA